MDDPSRRSRASRRLSTAAIALLLSLLAVTSAPAAFADATTSVAASPAATASAAATAAATASAAAATDTTATCALSATDVLYAQSVTVSGTISPVAEAVQVIITQGGVDVVTVTTDAAGAFSAKITARRSCSVTARVAPDGVASAPVKLTVRPIAGLKRGPAYPFLSTRIVLTVWPAAYDANVVANVWHRGRLLGIVHARCHAGSAVLLMPTPGIGSFTVIVKLPAASGLAARTVRISYTVAWRRLATGSTGPFVRGLLLRMAALGVHIPAVGQTFTRADADAVVAFQKAFRLPRTYVVDYDDWHKLDVATVARARYTSKGTHLEVDKTRQVLMVVRSGKILGLIAVSTGKTGNTPVGAYRIRHKSPYSTPLYGSGVLFRSMGFVGNFAIHGYPSVPPYPASHGCIREPLWAADWVYTHSFVGERLYIYV